jgi:hypothetical protein
VGEYHNLVPANTRRNISPVFTGAIFSLFMTVLLKLTATQLISSVSLVFPFTDCPTNLEAMHQSVNSPKLSQFFLGFHQMGQLTQYIVNVPHSFSNYSVASSDSLSEIFT